MQRVGNDGGSSSSSPTSPRRTTITTSHGSLRGRKFEARLPTIPENDSRRSIKSEKAEATRLARRLSRLIVALVHLISEEEENKEQGERLILGVFQRFKAVLEPKVKALREGFVMAFKISALVETGEKELLKMMRKKSSSDDDDDDSELIGFADGVVDRLTKTVLTLEECLSSNDSTDDHDQLGHDNNKVLEECEVDINLIREEIKSKRGMIRREILKKEMTLKDEELWATPRQRLLRLQQQQR